MKYVSIVVLLLLTACMGHRSEHSKALQSVTRQYQKSLHHIYCVQLTNYGGSLMYDVKEVSLGYNVFIDHDIATGRKAAVDCIDLFIDMINADEKIQPYLHERPFPPRCFTLSLSPRNPDGSRYTGEGVSYISCYNGKISYNKCDPITGRFVLLHKETYEEAKRIIGQEEQAVKEPSSYHTAS